MQLVFRPWWNDNETKFFIKSPDRQQFLQSSLFHSLNPEQIVYKVKDRLRQSAISQTLFSECVLGISSAATVCDLFASPPKSWRCESLLRMQRFLNDPNAMQKLIDKQHALNRRIRNKKRPIDDSISETLPRSKKMGPFYCPYGAECKVKHEFVTWNGLCAHIRHFHPSRQGSCPITGLIKDDGDCGKPFRRNLFKDLDEFFKCYLVSRVTEVLSDTQKDLFTKTKTRLFSREIDFWSVLFWWTISFS